MDRKATTVWHVRPASGGTPEGGPGLLHQFHEDAPRDVRRACSQSGAQDSEGGVGGSYIQKGGGGSYRNFRSRSKLLQGPGQINKQKKIADSRRRGGGGPNTQKKNLYPRMFYD